MHPIELLGTPCTCPEVSFPVASDPIAPPSSHVIKHLSIGKPGAVDNIEDIYILGMTRLLLRIDNIELFKIR
jgi:hypothetical protein